MLVKTNEALQVEILERKRPEDALKLTQFSIDRTADAIAGIGADAKFLYVNELHVIDSRRQQSL